MKKINKKGYMLIEIVIASVIALIMAYFLIEITIKLVNKNNDYYIDSILVADKNIITKEIMDDINSKKLIEVDVHSEYEVILKYDDTTEKKLAIDKENHTITYGDYKNELSKNLNIDTITLTNNGDILTITISAYTNYSKENYGIKITVPYSEDIEITYPKKPFAESNHPKVVKGLIPVIHNGTTWVTADETNESNNWYNYSEKRWANAVLVTNAKRASLTKKPDGTYVAGQEIGDTEAEGVLAFYVWIPRYKYKVWNINKVADQSVYTYDAYTNGIDIQFEEGAETTGGISCNYSFAAPVATAGQPNEVCTDKTGEGYYTHPAFTFGEDELTGFWMGKFELSSADQDWYNSGGGESTTLTPRTLPNVISWRGNPVSNFWLVINNMQASGNIYGLSTDRTNTDSHMLTNMEWGAVAYLTYSEYGRCTDGTCTEVAQNNNDGYRTGKRVYNGGSYTYEKPNGQLASTTGNIYGVYDMSGGTNEYVMGNISSTSGSYTYNKSSAGSNYTYEGFEKYITTYAYGTTNDNQLAYNRGRLGDATSEVLTEKHGGGWYGDGAQFPGSFYSWFRRGSQFGAGDSSAGVFAFRGGDGDLSNFNYALSARAALIGF